MTFPARATALVAASLFAGAVICEQETAWTLEAPKPAVALKPARLENLAGETCGECHADVVREWSGTAHAIAWVDEIYRDAIAERKRPESCHGCHIPRPILADGLARSAEARENDQHLGISCPTCHLGPEGAMLGPWGAATGAHASTSSEHMTQKGSSRLCAVCHSTTIGPVVGIAKDFAAANMEERGRSCIGCHTAPIERAPSKGAADGAATRSGRSHAIQTPRDPKFLAKAFEPSLRVDGGTFVVSIRNRAGHRVPGLIGREIEFRAEILDVEGKSVARKELVLDTRSCLAVDGKVEIGIEGKGSSVRLRGIHRDPRSEEPVEFLDARLQPGGH